MISNEVEKFEKISGEDASAVPISRISGYLDGYQKGVEDSLEQYTCHDDCENDNCSMCCRWDRLADCYQPEQKGENKC